MPDNTDNNCSQNSDFITVNADIQQQLQQLLSELQLDDAPAGGYSYADEQARLASEYHRRDREGRF